MDKGTADSIGSGLWKATKKGASAGWKGAKATAKATAAAIDEVNDKKVAAAAVLEEKKHKAEFAAARQKRLAAHKEATKGGGGSDLYAKHAGAVKATNDFGLSADAADAVRGGAPPEPEPEPLGKRLGGMFGGKPKKSEKEELLEMAAKIGWDEDMLEATLEGFDGDLAQTRSFLEQQAA